MSLVLSVARTPPLESSQNAVLAELVGRGRRLGTAAFRGAAGAPPAAELGRVQRFVYRRWVLETLLALLERPRGFNDLRRALGSPAGQSVAPKLQALAAAGLLIRQGLGGRPPKVRYALTPDGADVAVAVFALTHGKAEHMRALASWGRPWDFELPSTDAPLDPHDILDEAKAYADRARAFMVSRLASPRPPDRESPFETARRLSEACTRKWHAQVLSTLAGGPRRFSELKAVLPVGSQALAQALRGLEELKTLEKTSQGTYRILPLGAFDLALGGPVVVEAWRCARVQVHAV